MRSIEIYNALGQYVRTLIDKYEAAGSYSITWDGKSETGQSMSTGVYLYRFKSGEKVETKKMMLVN